MTSAYVRCVLLPGLLLCTACAQDKPPPPAATAAAGAARSGCLPSGDGFLRARVQGAIDAQLDWHDAQMSCEGGLRPDASGVRVSFVGPVAATPGAAADRLRFVFGISNARPNEGGRALATNLTVILEREHRIYATLGDDKCTVDLLQQRVLPGKANSYRVEARGFCIAPATRVGGDQRLLLSTFDFAGRITLEPVAPQP